MKRSQLKQLIKEVVNEWSQSDNSSKQAPEEKREVQIGRDICKIIHGSINAERGLKYSETNNILQLAQELIAMHSNSVSEGEVFNGNLDHSSDCISENTNILDVLDIDTNELFHISNLASRIPVIWKKLFRNSKNPEVVKEFLDNLYGAVAELEKACKIVKTKIDPNLGQ